MPTVRSLDCARGKQTGRVHVIQGLDPRMHEDDIHTIENTDYRPLPHYVITLHGARCYRQLLDCAQGKQTDTGPGSSYARG